MHDQTVPLLFRLFRDRLFEDDSAGPGSGFEANIWQILGFLLAAGWFIAYFLTPQMLRLSTGPASLQTDWTIFSLRMLFTSFTFAVVGFGAVFQWDTLFPDRRDFLILGTLPVSPWKMLAARVGAVAWLLLLLVAGFNVFPVGMMIVLSILVPALHGFGWKLVIAQLLATGAAAAFALLAVAALQGILMNLLSPRVFRRLSPAVQMIGMSAMVLCALLYPIYSLLIPTWARTNGMWPLLLPPVWFAGLYDLVIPSHVEAFAAYGTHGLRLLAGAAAVASLAWTTGYARHCRRTLEAEDTRPRSRVRLKWLPGSWVFRRSEEERAISVFLIRTLASSNRHRLFLATYLSVGLALAILFAVSVRSGKLTLSHGGLRALPFCITFFVISGFRAVSQFPAELPANWLFRLAEANWPEAARQAVRRQALLRGLIPTVIAMLPLELAVFGYRAAALHAALQLLAGALLTEAMFRTFDKVPFTCSWFPGSMNLSLLAGLYLYGFTTYSFHLASLEADMETNAVLTAAVFLVGAALVAYAWWRKQPATALRFDGDEPLVRTLDLT